MVHKHEMHIVRPSQEGLFLSQSHLKIVRSMMKKELPFLYKRSKHFEAVIYLSISSELSLKQESIRWCRFQPLLKNLNIRTFFILFFWIKFRNQRRLFIERSNYLTLKDWQVVDLTSWMRATVVTQRSDMLAVCFVSILGFSVM